MERKNTIVIAEAGVNHNGDIQIAKKLIDVAAEAGADYVKFQTFTAEKIASPRAAKAAYQSSNTAKSDDKQIEMLKRLELNQEQHLELISHCKTKAIKFLSSAFDVEGVAYLHKLGLDIFKSPSGELTNYPYLKALAKTGCPVILSTGMASLGEIEVAIGVLEEHGCGRKQIIVLHCNTEYPTPMEDVNLKAMNTIGNAFGVEVGYSDHTLGIEVPIAAVALGAKIVEKHFTLDRDLSGPDHKASLEPKELGDMIKAIRNIELAMSGTQRKEVTKSELQNKVIARKSIHVAKKLKKGDVLKEDTLIALRPGNGISPMFWNQVIGRKINCNKSANEILNWNDLS